jgi:hypothetical protein
MREQRIALKHDAAARTRLGRHRFVVDEEPAARWLLDPEQSAGLDGAQDITVFGGWRSYLASRD